MKVWNKRDPNRPRDAVYVGRGTPWGNPFVMFTERQRNMVCDDFEREVLPTLDVSALRGKDLVCWCAPKRCHADGILRKANASVDRSPEGEKSQALNATHESAVGSEASETPHTSQNTPKETSHD
jgi:hypothetical protein